MWRYWMACLLASLTLSISAWALEPPSGRVVLTISGQITHTNHNQFTQFDAAMLDALPQREIVTHSPWYEGPNTFSGPLLRDVLQAVGAQGQELVLQALNDYRAIVPVSDAQRFDAILAQRMNGQELTVRDKGPLFLIYPYDSLSELQSTVYYGRSVWQVVQIEVR